MRKIKIIAVGSLNPQFKALFSDYEKNIKPYCDFSVVEIKELSNEKNIEIKKQKETKMIMNYIDKNSYVVLNTLRGKEVDSVKFSQMVDQNINLTFIIGGSDGIDEQMLQGDFQLNFGLMTFPHQLFRVMLIEQIYRAFSILNNKKYHK